MWTDICIFRIFYFNKMGGFAVSLTPWKPFLCSVLSPPPSAPLQSWVTCDLFAQGQAVMELGFKLGTVGSKALKLGLLVVGKKGRLGGSPALSDLLKTMGEREGHYNLLAVFLPRKSHGQGAWSSTVRVVAKESLNSNYRGFAPPIWAAPANPETCSFTCVFL